MTLTQIFVFAALGLLAGRFYKSVSRNWLLFVTSVLAVFWLQPAGPIRNLYFILPSLSLGLAALVWALTVPKDYARRKQDVRAAALLAVLILLVSATRYFEPLCCLTATRPPQIEFALVVVAVLGFFGLLAYRFSRGRVLLIGLITLLILAILAFLKSPALAHWVSGTLRGLSGQDISLASPLDLGWLGFSYIAFRLIHALRDRLAGRLPNVTLRDFVTFIVFFPALTAGPIDRIQRFRSDLDRSFILNSDQLYLAGRRLLTGLFMKFVLADTLAFFALNQVNAQQVNSAGWMWVILLAYSFRIFFDFAGYTHIAIGLGMLFGIILPENFDRPYLKSNLTQFWNSWHMTLTQWVRAYYFNPLTRALRSRNVAVWAVILFGQISTMVVIGLWHGITWNFLVWGLWHGGGLFIHNQHYQWAQHAKTRSLVPNPRISQAVGIAATFMFVTIGWVWFALAEPADALRVFRTLLGLGI